MVTLINICYRDISQFGESGRACLRDCLLKCFSQAGVLYGQQVTGPPPDPNFSCVTQIPEEQ
jgi:hypothetical protein